MSNRVSFNHAGQVVAFEHPDLDRCDPARMLRAALDLLRDARHYDAPISWVQVESTDHAGGSLRVSATIGACTQWVDYLEFVK